jgi:hypothetical protein
MPVSEFGVFLGATGSPRHVVIGKFYVHRDRAWHAARILESLVVGGKMLVKKSVPDSWLRRYTIKSYAKREFVVRRNGVQA